MVTQVSKQARQEVTMENRKVNEVSLIFKWIEWSFINFI